MTSRNFKKKITPAFVTFRHAALDPQYDVTNFYPPLTVCNVAYKSIWVSNTTQIFGMLWHIWDISIVYQRSHM